MYFLSPSPIHLTCLMLAMNHLLKRLFNLWIRLCSLLSEVDVTIVAGDVVRTIFQKPYSAALTDRNANENQCDTITIPANASFPEHASGGEASVFNTLLDRNQYTLQPRVNIDKLTKGNVVEDITQSVLTNLKMFATSKVKSLFCPHIDFTVPVTLPFQRDMTALSQPWLSTKHSYSGDQLSCCSVDHNKSGKTTTVCQLTVSKLNIYATQVARQILQGIELKLDKEIKSPFLTHNVVSESITSQIVNTMLHIVSTKGKYEKYISDGEFDPGWPRNIVEELFNQSDYRKKLQFQILDTIGDILSDICEKTLDENPFSLAASSLQGNVGEIQLGANSGMFSEYASKAIPTLLVPKPCVAMISNDMVNIVLQNLSSAVMLGINAKDSISARSSLTLSDAFPNAECQQSPVVDSSNERKRKSFQPPRKIKDVQLKSAYSDDNQITILKKQDSKQSAPDPCEANANFITKAIFNRLKSFATERIDLLFTLDSKTREKSFVSPEFTNCKQENSIFLEANQMPSGMNRLKISTGEETILSQEANDYAFSN